MTNETQAPTIDIVHTDDGITLRIPVGLHLYTMIGLPDAAIEQIYEERKRRRQDKRKIVTPGLVKLSD